MSSNVEASCSKDAITIERGVVSPLFFSKWLLLKGEIKDGREVAKLRLEFKEEERREGLNILSGNEGVTSVYIYI
jgi:hypothetical protein